MVSTLLVLTGIILGIVITYLYMKASKVSRYSFEEIQQKLIAKNTEFTISEKQIQELSNELKEYKEKNLYLTDTQNKLNNDLIKADTEKNLKISQLSEAQEANKKLQHTLEELTQQKQNYLAENSKLKAQNDSLNILMNNQKLAIEKLQDDAKLHFENIANKILEEKTEKFTATNKETIDNILKPLEKNLESFKNKVNEVYHNEARERHSLENTIKIMMEHSNKISQEANNLASALKGQTKVQGDWGEMILESILENSGLSKDREYFAQQTIKNQEGENLRPDFIIKFPDNKEVIIDSKVSLNSYEKMTSANTIDEEKYFMKLHIQALKNHINTLAEKSYHKITANAIDFTIMFIPIEPAFLMAIQHDKNLWNYAYQKNVIMLSPTNLIAYLKLISEVWKKYNQNKNAEEIARQAGDLYDKFTGLIKDLTNIGEKLNDAKSNYEAAMNKLSEGKGNLVRRVQHLKELGIKSKKELPNTLIEKSCDE